VRRMVCEADREEISRGLSEGLQYSEIGARIGRDPSVVSREVGRHGGRGAYRAHAAEEAARVLRERPKQLAVDRYPRLRAVVHRMLAGGWSPASIAGRLPTDYPDDHACRVSHEAVYTWVSRPGLSGGSVVPRRLLPASGCDGGAQSRARRVGRARSRRAGGGG
jgi:IS30 family transposase